MTDKNETLTFAELTKNINSAKYRNSQGRKYSEGKRGIPYILTLVYHYLQDRGDQEGADMVENSFTKQIW